MFNKARICQHGKWVYFTEDLDSCWIYGSEKKANNTNPKESRRCLGIWNVSDCFSFIASAIYYDKNGFRRIYWCNYHPKKNEINFTMAGMNSLESVLQIYPKKFYGTEYYIYDLEQIFPFLAFKLKRIEYCIIWRDNNFSKIQINNN